MDHSKDDVIEEEQAFLSPQPSSQDAAWSHERGSHKGSHYLRLILEVVMAATIVVLLAYILHERLEVERTPVPKCMRFLNLIKASSGWLSRNVHSSAENVQVPPRPELRTRRHAFLRTRNTEHLTQLATLELR